MDSAALSLSILANCLFLLHPLWCFMHCLLFFKFLPFLFLSISSILSSHEILSLLLSPFILLIFVLHIFDSHSFSLCNQTTSTYFFCTNHSFCIQSNFSQSFIHNPISSCFYLVYIYLHFFYILLHDIHNFLFHVTNGQRHALINTPLCFFK